MQETCVAAMSSVGSKSRDSSNQSPPAAVNMRAVGSTILAAGAVSTTSHSRPVTVRVLSGTTYPRPPVAEDKVNFNVKIFNPENKKEQHVFVLRDVTRAVASTPETLMEELQRQFGSHVNKRHHLSIGYTKGSLKVSIRTPADMRDVWLRASKGESVVLWCEGVGYHAGSDSDDDFPKN